MNPSFSKSVSAVALAGLTAIPGVASAAGFALLEQNASEMGLSYSGTAASAADASTIFFNPAGLTMLQRPQVVVAGASVSLNSTFSGTGSTNMPGIALGNNTGGNAGSTGFVPSIYASTPIGERWAIGLGVNAPFGLKTEYDNNWLGRFQGIYSRLTTVNVNPSVAFKVNDAISLGAGVNMQSIDVTLSNAVFLGAATEGRSQLSANDTGWGWNLGALFQLGNDMRVGISYRSAIDYTLSGNVSTTTPLGTVVFPAQADVKLPDNFLLSVTQMYGDKWQLLGDLQYTHWSTVGTVNVINTSNGRTADQLALNFDNAWRLAFGVNYFANDKWTIRGGMAYDQSPVNSDNRTVRLPDTDRFWLSVGAQFKFGKGSALDFAYAHVFAVNSSGINQQRYQYGTPFYTAVTGSYDNSVNLLSLQFTQSF